MAASIRAAASARRSPTGSRSTASRPARRSRREVARRLLGRSGSIRAMRSAIRTSFPAASASASASRARSRPIRPSWSPTSRSARSTSRSRRRSWSCSPRAARAQARAAVHQPRSAGGAPALPTASWSCISAASSKRARPRPCSARPAHPYTRALVSATPRIDPASGRTRIILPGDPPSPTRAAVRLRLPHALRPRGRRLRRGRTAACKSSGSTTPHACIRLSEIG